MIEREHTQVTKTRREFKIAFVVNPIAGMGGSVGLKGTDGDEILQKAIALGALPRAESRAVEFLRGLAPLASRITVMVPPGSMGGDIFTGTDLPGLHHEVFNAGSARDVKKTTGTDTIQFVDAIKHQVDVLVFVGGDGTARDVLEGMGNDGNAGIPVLGVPAGVKIHSSVFGTNPASVAMVVMRFLSGEIGVAEGEVMDIDEDAFRNDRVDSRLYGYLKIPHEPAFMQGAKHGSPSTVDEEDNKQRIAEHVVAEMNESTVYIIGPGSTTKPVMDQLGLKKTLLGVDAVLGRQTIGLDLNEAGIRGIINRARQENKQVKLVVTAIGSQGFVFGRGNLQFTPDVIRSIGVENIFVIMTRHKVSTLPGGKLKNDTRDPQLDEEMRGYYRVLVDDGEYKIIEMT